MSIGVFDSGVGGLTVHRALVNRLPQADFTYLADQAKPPPYGGRPGEEVVALTKAGCERLFDTASQPGGPGLQLPPRPSPCAACSRPGCRATARNWAGRSTSWASSSPTIEAATGLPWEHEAERRGDKVEQLDVLGVCSRPRARPIRASTRSRSTSASQDNIAVFSQPCPDLVPD